MAVPDSQTFMLPVLRYAGSRCSEEILMKALLDARAKEFSLSDADLRGEQLTNLMIDHGVGFATAATYEVKRVDSDYFAESEE